MPVDSTLFHLFEFGAPSTWVDELHGLSELIGACAQEFTSRRSWGNVEPLPQTGLHRARTFDHSTFELT